MKRSAAIALAAFSLLSFGAQAQGTSSQKIARGSGSSYSYADQAPAPASQTTNADENAAPEYNFRVGQSWSTLIRTPGGALHSSNSLPKGW